MKSKTLKTYKFYSECLKCGEPHSRGLFFPYKITCGCGQDLTIPPSRRIAKSQKLSSLTLAKSNAEVSGQGTP